MKSNQTRLRRPTNDHLIHEAVAVVVRSHIPDLEAVAIQFKVTDAVNQSLQQAAPLHPNDHLDLVAGLHEVLVQDHAVELPHQMQVDRVAEVVQVLGRAAVVPHRIVLVDRPEVAHAQNRAVVRDRAHGLALIRHGQDRDLAVVPIRLHAVAVVVPLDPVVDRIKVSIFLFISIK